MKGIHEGSLMIDRDERVLGVVTGDLVVAPDRRVEVCGIVRGDLVVEEGADVLVTGIIGGRVVERGGRATITGIASAG